MATLGPSGNAPASTGTTAVTESDGANVILGATANTTASSTIYGKLLKLISVIPAALGQTTMSASTPVTIASDQARVAVYGAAGGAGGDAASATVSFLTDSAGVSRGLAVYPALFNNTAWDRQRNNFDGTVGITGTGVTTTQTGADQTNWNGRGVIVVLDMTVVGTGSVTLTIQGKDTASGKYYTLLAGAAVVTNSTNVYVIYPGYTAAANVAVNSPLPRTWRAVVTANNANATTYTVGASVLL